MAAKNAATGFELYQCAYEAGNKSSIQAKKNDDATRAVRRFDIKLRLAKGMQVDFDSSISRTKTASVKKCYITLVKLASYWNALEAFAAFTKCNGGTDKWFKLTECVFSDNEANEILLKGLKDIQALFAKKAFQENFVSFAEKIESVLGKDGQTKNNLAAFQDAYRYFKESRAVEKVPSPLVMLRLMNIERNIFYHSGESVKMDLPDYTNREKLLQLYMVTLEKYLLRLGTNAFSDSGSKTSRQRS
jgi:hypothetical protein